MEYVLIACTAKSKKKNMYAQIEMPHAVAIVEVAVKQSFMY